MTTDYTMPQSFNINREGTISIGHAGNDAAISMTWDGSKLSWSADWLAAGNGTASISDPLLTVFQNALTHTLRLGPLLERACQINHSTPDGLVAKPISLTLTFPGYHSGEERKAVRSVLKGFPFLNVVAPASRPGRFFGLFLPSADPSVQGTPYLIPTVRNGITGWRLCHVHVSAGHGSTVEFAEWNDTEAVQELVSRLGSDEPECVAAFTILEGGASAEALQRAEAEAAALKAARKVFTKRSLRVNRSEITRIVRSALSARRGIYWTDRGMIDLLPRYGAVLTDDGRAKNSAYLFSIYSFSSSMASSTNVDPDTSTALAHLQEKLKEAGYQLGYETSGLRNQAQLWIVRDIELANKYLAPLENATSVLPIENLAS